MVAPFCSRLGPQNEPLSRGEIGPDFFHQLHRFRMGATLSEQKENLALFLARALLGAQITDYLSPRTKTK